MLQTRQQYETFIQSLQYERDEAIRTKTLDTAELRRQNSVLKDCVRDLERQSSSRTFPTNGGSDAFTSEFHQFDSLDLGEDSWDEDYSFVGGDDLKMDGEDSPQRQLTPRPPPAPQYTTGTLVSVSPTKNDPGFSWNTFCMCLLLGAFISSQPTSTIDVLKSTTQASSSAPATEGTTSSAAVLSALPDDYRVEAGNMLKAVLASEGSTGNDVGMGSQSSSQTRTDTQPQPSSLDALSATLTTPTRHQQVAAAFSLTPTQYEHITNPDGILDSPTTLDTGFNTVPDTRTAHPTTLQAMFASMQAERDSIDRMAGLGSKARERSVLLERVPEKVLQDFRKLVAESQAQKDEDVI
jgi:hypothetical protein